MPWRFGAWTDPGPPAVVVSFTVQLNRNEAIPLGQSGAYDLTVTNAGPGDASGVVLEDFLPPGVSFEREPGH